MLQLIVGQYEDRGRLVMGGETSVALLYNVLKILLGIDQIPEHIMNVLSLIFRQYNMPTPNNYNETVFRLFIIIKIVIFKQSESLTNNITKSEEHINSRSIHFFIISFPLIRRQSPIN